MREDLPGVETIHCSAERMAEMLDSTRWASNFTWPEITAITTNMRAYGIEKDKYLFLEGDSDQYMGIIVKGKVQILKSDPKKGENILATLGPAHTLGEMGLLDGQPRSAKARAKTDVIMLVLYAQDMIRLHEANAPVAFKVLWQISQMLSQRLRRTSGLLVDSLQ